MWKKYLKWFSFVSLILIILSIVFANYSIDKSTDHLIYSDVNLIPAKRVGILLGTSKRLKSGKPNQYFSNRIDATIDLYNAGKIEFLVISGDNCKRGYSEPEDMKNELLKKGFPADKIFLDYAGFRTFDSVFRMKAIFGQTDFTIISQEFHNRRAIYIARHLGLNAIGFNAKDVTAYMGFKTKVRELFSRVKMFIDLHTGKQPKFLGEKIEIK